MGELTACYVNLDVYVFFHHVISPQQVVEFQEIGDWLIGWLDMTHPVFFFSGNMIQYGMLWHLVEDPWRLISDNYFV